MQKLNQIPRFEEWMTKIKEARFCGTCKNWYMDEYNKENLRYNDMCHQCEHIELEKFL